MIKLDNLVTLYQTRNDCWKDGKLLKPVKGIMVHSTATPGVMARTFATAWNASGIEKAVHAFVDDIEIIQCFDWNKRAWHSGLGTTGKRANDTHIGFEICEPPGHHYEGGNMINYNVNKYQSYFTMVYGNAVRLCAYLCQVYDLDPLEPGVIITHSEGYKLGIASNHSDVMHWFPKHGKSMDTFRMDVQKLIEADEFDNKPDMYAQDAIRWAIDNGIVKGDTNGDYKLHDTVTRQDSLVFLKRAFDIYKLLK